MAVDSEGNFDPFCLESNVVDVLEEIGDGYLTQVVKDVDGTKIKQPGRYFIIPKTHMEWLLLRPPTWTRDENSLLDVAFAHAARDAELTELMRGRSLDESLNLSWNQGKWAGQKVKHIHNWVCFRYDDVAEGLDGCVIRAQAHMVAQAEAEFGKAYDLSKPGLPH